MSYPLKARFRQSDLSTPLFASVHINELFSETASFCKAPEGHRLRHQSTRSSLVRVRMMAAVRVSDCLERKNLPALNIRPAAYELDTYLAGSVARNFAASSIFAAFQRGWAHTYDHDSDITWNCHEFMLCLCPSAGPLFRAVRLRRSSHHGPRAAPSGSRDQLEFGSPSSYGRPGSATLPPGVRQPGC